MDVMKESEVWNRFWVVWSFGKVKKGTSFAKRIFSNVTLRWRFNRYAVGNSVMSSSDYNDFSDFEENSLHGGHVCSNCTKFMNWTIIFNSIQYNIHVIYRRSQVNGFLFSSLLCNNDVSRLRCHWLVIIGKPQCYPPCQPLCPIKTLLQNWVFGLVSMDQRKQS